MLKDDTQRVVRDWASPPRGEMVTPYTVSGNRLVTMSSSGGWITVAVRYQADDSGETVIITKDDALLPFLTDPDIMVVSLNSSTAGKIFRYFDAEHSVLCGKSVTDIGSAIRYALKSLGELGLPLSTRLREASRAPEDNVSAMYLLAFKDLYVPRRFRYAIYNHGLRLPKRLSKSFHDYAGFMILESEQDAVQIKMAADDEVSIIDLWPVIAVECPPSK